MKQKNIMHRVLIANNSKIINYISRFLTYMPSYSLNKNLNIKSDAIIRKLNTYVCLKAHLNINIFVNKTPKVDMSD